MDRVEADNAERAASGPVGVDVCHDRPDWAAYLARRPDATIFHDPRWGEVMERVYGNRPYYLTARRGETVAGVLQLVLQKSVLFGTHLCSLPYFDAAGVLADDADAAAALLAKAGNLMSETRCRWVELRQAAALGAGLETRTDKIGLELALPGDAGALWDGFDAKVRNQVRKAERAGVALEQGGAALLGEFHAVYARNMRDLGSPPHSRRFFEGLAASFGDAVRVFVVRLHEQPVGGSLVIVDGATVHLPWAASDWRHRGLCGNMLLYWGMMKAACEGGAACFDFGRSARGSGTHQFKKQWGAEEVPLYWHYLLPPGGKTPAAAPEEGKYRLAMAVWRRMPVALVRALGPRLIAKLS